jgi:hypothetical protein
MDSGREKLGPYNRIKIGDVKYEISTSAQSFMKSRRGETQW